MDTMSILAFIYQAI